MSLKSVESRARNEGHEKASRALHPTEYEYQVELLDIISPRESRTMTEFRRNSSPPGLFATKSYEAGDLILDEAPLFVFRPVSAEQDAVVTSQFRNISANPHAETTSAAASSGNTSKKKKNKKKKGKKAGRVKFSASLGDIQPPPSVDKTYAGKFRAMVTAAGTYAIALANNGVNNETRRRILALYAPNIECPGDDERQIVSTACAALKYCRENAVDGSNLATLVNGDNHEKQKECLQIMLVWSCNAFEGGVLYEQTSRANHSCDANAIVRESSVLSSLAASASADTSGSSNDRDNGFHQPKNQQLVAATTIQAGDEVTVSYLGIFAYTGGSVRQDQLRRTKHFTCRCSRCTGCDKASAIPCPSCHPRVNGRYLDEEVQYDDEKIVKYAYSKNAYGATQGVRCEHCHESTSTASLMTMVKKVTDKVTDRLQPSTGTQSKNADDAAADVEQEIDEQLFHLASSVLGARHWTTNVMALSMLERQLSAIHSATLMGGPAPDLTELAECIDTLQRLWTFVGGLQLRADAGHLLSGPTIGVARALVSLGDVKSRKYAAEWVARVEDYVQRFEGDGMAKVAEALKESWKRDDLQAVTNEDMEEVEEEEDMGSNKRARVS